MTRVERLALAASLTARGQRALAQRGGEQRASSFRARPGWRRCIRGVPRRREAGGVVIADDRAAFSFGRRQPHQSGVRFGKSPGQQERVGRRLACRDGALQAQRTDRAVRRRLRAQRSIVGEIVPEQHGGVPPAALRPTSPAALFSPAPISAAHRTNSPCMGWSAVSPGLRITSPDSDWSVR